MDLLRIFFTCIMMLTSVEQLKAQTPSYAKLTPLEQSAILGSVTRQTLWNIQELQATGYQDGDTLHALGKTFRYFDLSDMPALVPPNLSSAIQLIRTKAYALRVVCDERLAEEFDKPIEAIEYSCGSESYLVYDPNSDFPLGAVIRVTNHRGSDDDSAHRISLYFMDAVAARELYKTTLP